jgi:hypothetical protein
MDMSEINQPAVIRAGLIGGAVNLVFLLAIAFIDGLICVAFWIPLAMGLATGVLYGVFAKQNGFAIDVRRGAMGGSAAGLIVGVVGIVVTIILAVVGGGGITGSVTTALIFPALIGAAGGAAYGWYVNRNNPSTPAAPQV